MQHVARSAAAMRAAATRGANATMRSASSIAVVAPPTPSALAHSAFAASPLLRAAHRSHALLFHSNARSFNTAEPAAADASAESASAAAPPAAEPVPRQNKTFRLPLWADAPKPQLISLDNLKSRPKKRALRYGRGRGSGLGKTCGRGVKGQGQRKGLRKRGFEGGSTPFWRRMPKIGHNTHSRYYKMFTPLTVEKVVEFVKMGRIDGTQLITMKTLLDSGCLRSIPHGVKLLTGGLQSLSSPLHIQVSDCSQQARTLLEGTGGSLHLVWFNRMTLRAHLNPIHFLRKYGRLPKHTGVPPPKKAAKYGFVIEHVDY